MMDLDAITSRYYGEAKLQRLLFLATHGSALAPVAAQLAQAHIVRAGNLVRYKELVAANALSMDPVWVQHTESSNRQNRDILCQRLSAAQSHLHKDSIRTAYLALAEHDTKVGDVTEAYHSLMRAKDYCTTRQQTATVSLHILEISIALKNFASVREYVSKLEHTISGESSSMPDVTTKLNIASGLEALSRSDYSRAASQFAAASKLATEAWGTVLSNEDVAMYAGLLTLATSSRGEMVALAEHPEALELVPALREGLVLFGRRGNYKQSWHVCESVFEVLTNDMHMVPHLTSLQQLIRQKTLLQYWKPYRRVSFANMAEDLGPGLVPSQDFLISHMVEAIASGAAPSTRIDLQSYTLVREESDAEEAKLEQTQAKVAQLTTDLLTDTYCAIVRLACIEHELVVSDASAPRRSKRRGTGRHAGPEFVDWRGGDDDSSDEFVDDDVMEDTAMMDIGDEMNPEDLY